MVTKMVTKRKIELRHCFTLHPWRNMRIDVHRHRDCRMAQALLHDLRMHATRQQLRRMSVAKIMEPDPRKTAYPPNQISELVRKACRLLRLTMNPTADQRVTGLANAKA